MKKEIAIKILILTEAGDKIGFGHYTRCSAIQESLKEAGHTCLMLLNLKGKHALKFEGASLDWQNNKSDLVEYKEQGFSHILVDSYLANLENYTWLQDTFEQIFIIDDYNRIVYNGGMLINPNVFATDIDYSNQTKVAAIYGGKDFVILRDVFRNGNASDVKEEVQNIVITVGGSDYRNLIPQIVPIVQKELEHCQISVIAGNPILQKKLQNEFPTVKILGLLSAKEMHDVFQNGDIIISACGQTLHELASIGKPAIGICLDIDQVPNQAFYTKIGFIASNIEYDNLNLLPQELSNLQSQKERKKRQEIGLKAINKNGVKTISQVITT